MIYENQMLDIQTETVLIQESFSKNLEFIFKPFWTGQSERKKSSFNLFFLCVFVLFLENNNVIGRQTNLKIESYPIQISWRVDTRRVGELIDSFFLVIDCTFIL